MDRSVYIARLIGPVFIIVGLGLAINAPFYSAMATQVLASPALIYFSGVLTLLGGLAIVLGHNIWDGSWRVIVSALGWLGIFGGVFRILAPNEVTIMGNKIIAYGTFPIVAALVVLVVGCALSYFGYADTGPAKPRARKRSRR